MKNDLRELAFGAGKLFMVENYLEAVGVMTASPRDKCRRVLRCVRFVGRLKGRKWFAKRLRMRRRWIEGGVYARISADTWRSPRPKTGAKSW